MSKEKYESGCEGCRPILIDITTKKVLPSDHPSMIAINSVYNGLEEREKEAFHRFTCLNIKGKEELSVVVTIQERLRNLFKSDGC